MQSSHRRRAPTHADERRQEGSVTRVLQRAQLAMELSQKLEKRDGERCGPGTMRKENTGNPFDQRDGLLV